MNVTFILFVGFASNFRFLVCFGGTNVAFAE
jgi:hypothetical protein